MGKLKPGWRRVKFGQVVHLNRDKSKAPEADGLERYVGLEHIEPGDLRVRSWGDLADGTTFTNRFGPGQVLFGKRRAYQRKVGVADFAGVCSGDIYVLEPKDPSAMLPALLPFICRTDAFFEHAVGTSAGSLSPRTSWRQLSEFEFALPPISQQHSLVSLLRPAFDVHEALTDTLASLHEARRSVLKELLSRHAALGATKAYQVDELARPDERALKTGPFGTKLRTEMFRPSGVPVVPIGAITDDGLDCTKFDHISPADAESLGDYRVDAGDIVFSRVADVGRCHLVQPQEAGYVISSNLIRIRVHPEIVEPHYLWLLLRHSVAVREQIAGLATQAVGNGRWLVNTKTMARLGFPIPPIPLQRSAVQTDLDLSASRSETQRRIDRAQSLCNSLLRDALTSDVG